MSEMVEPWLRGTLNDVDALRRAVLHALELAAEDVARWCDVLNGEEMETQPLGLPSVGFQLRHIARSLDRLLTYAENQKLSERQLKLLKTEEEFVDREATLMEFAEAIEVSTKRVLSFSEKSYEQPRTVGRKKLPTTVGALLVHCADHTQRHVGQAITTAKTVIALREK
jgi:uncharacterized damage-inducible protein DinB